MAKKTISLTIEKYYSKTAQIEFEVDDHLEDDELIDFLVGSKEVEDALENAVESEEYVLDDVIYHYSDESTHSGGHF